MGADYMNEIIENFFNIDVLVRSKHLLMIGVINTLKLIVLSVIIAIALGLILAVARQVKSRALSAVIILYVDVIRACPAIVLLMLIYYALPFAGIRMNSFAAATVAIGLNGAAYYAEIFRSGIEAIPRGQAEAARGSGLSFLQTIRYVILPQAFPIILPPLTTNTLELIKGTAIAATVALPDLLWQALQAQSTTLNSTPLTGALLIYIVILFPLVQLVSYFERRLKNAS